jgi:cation diffusion facilitator family transporter
MAMGFKTRVTIVTLVVSLVVLGLKYLGFRLTGSVALYSDALESIVNVATAIATLIAVSVSAKPADANHPYGHNKAEYLSAVLESAFILVAALEILRQAYNGFIAPQPLQAPFLGIALNVLSSVINGAWAVALLRIGRNMHSPALVADGHHLWSDVVSSVGVVVGVALVALTGWKRLDAVIAALVAVNVLWSGWKVLRNSVGGLMDESLPVEEMSELRAIILAHADGSLQANSLRARRSGPRVFVEFNLVVPAAMEVATAHAICDRLEAAIHAWADGSSIFIHLEPEQKLLVSPNRRIVALAD